MREQRNPTVPQLSEIPEQDAPQFCSTILSMTLTQKCQTAAISSMDMLYIVFAFVFGHHLWGGSRNTLLKQFVE